MRRVQMNSYFGSTATRGCTIPCGLAGGGYGRRTGNAPRWLSLRPPDLNVQAAIDGCKTTEEWGSVADGTFASVNCQSQSELSGQERVEIEPGLADCGQQEGPAGLLALTLALFSRICPKLITSSSPPLLFFFSNRFYS